MPFLFSLLFSLLLAQTSTEDTLKKGLVEPAVKDPLINEVVTYKPIKDHHFNLEAPQNCGAEATMDPTARKITCQFHGPGVRQVVLSVCDNAKKYCKQELIDVSVRKQKSGTPRIKTAPSDETLKMQKETKKKLMADFKSMTPEEAKKAVKSKKALLAMVSTDWCPPCNVAKEFLLPTKEFKKATQDLLLVYVDGDSPASDAWKPLLKTRFFPTFVVLNKKMESVALFSDGEASAHIKKIEDALTTLNDPYTRLEARTAERIKGHWLQKIKDWFVSQKSLDKDEKRYLDYLGARGKLSEKIKTMKDFSQEKYKDKIALAETIGPMMGEPGPELPKEEAKARKLKLSLQVLQQPVKDNGFYPYILADYCSMVKEKDSKKQSAECLKYEKKYLSFIDQEQKNTSQALNAQEKIIGQGYAFSQKAYLQSALGREKQALESYSQCFDNFGKLYDYSPLKKKSRSVRLQQLYCMKGENSSENKLEMLISLVKDYPFEETFQRKLAAYYIKKKDFKKASEYNEKALKYSYGTMWAQNMAAKAKILKGLKKKQEALAVLEQAIDEFVLEKEGRESNTMKMLRMQHEALKKELTQTS